MPNIHRLNDCNTGGGCIDTIPQSTVFANGLLVCVNGSKGTSHSPCPEPVIHCSGNWDTSGGSSSVFIKNIPINDSGDSDTCGHIRGSGSSNTFTHGS